MFGRGVSKHTQGLGVGASRGSEDGGRVQVSVRATSAFKHTTSDSLYLSHF